MRFLGALCLYFLATSKHVLNDECKGCDEPTALLYRALQCPPVYNLFGACCPVSYNCVHIEKKASKRYQKCFFHGAQYGEHEEVNARELTQDCLGACTCHKRINIGMLINCVLLECPDQYGATPQPGCHFNFEINQCCSTGEICPPFAVNCSVDGKIYHEGEKFYPYGSNCLECICNEGFAGKLEEPYCLKKFCTDEAQYQREVYDFCAPVYSRRYSDCCPGDWVCPSRSDVIAYSSKSKYPELKCKFGEKSYKIGDKIEKTGPRTITCECRIPPYLTCVETFQPANDLWILQKSKNSGAHAYYIFSNLIFILILKTSLYCINKTY